jgi:hypothetical protein
MNIGRKISATIGVTLMCAISAVSITVGELLVVRTSAYTYHIWRNWTDYKDFVKSVWVRDVIPGPDDEPRTY